eukprot:13586375-Alexandrium_andersonii.AAC.1
MSVVPASLADDMRLLVVVEDGSEGQQALAVIRFSAGVTATQMFVAAIGGRVEPSKSKVYASRK